MAHGIERGTLADLAKKDIWYHNIELTDGIVTSGRKNLNSSITRALVSNVDVSNKVCVDLGTMDALYGVLLARMGASRVLCSDRLNRVEQIKTVKSALGAEFIYVPNTGILNFASVLKKEAGQLADYLNVPGVLYHMYDPMGGLARMRGLVRRGGLVLVDTPAFTVDDYWMYFNHSGGLYTHSTYFVPTVRCLQAMLERVGLYPIDCRWGNPVPFGNRKMIRIAVMCRAWDPTVVYTGAESHPSMGERPAAAKRRLTSVDVDNMLEYAEPESLFAPNGPKGTFSKEDAGVVYRKGQNKLTGYRPIMRIDLQRYCTKVPATKFVEQDNVLYLKDGVPQHAAE